MFDIGFWELLVIAVVLLLVLGPGRLPDVAKQAAFLVRKARQGVFRLRSEMRTEMDGAPFEDLENAKREIADFKNDLKQFGRDLADSAEQEVNDIEAAKPRTSIDPAPSPKGNADYEAEVASEADVSSGSDSSVKSEPPVA